MGRRTDEGVLGDILARLNTAIGERDAALERIKALEHDERVAHEALREASRERRETLAQFGELKARLHSAESEVARQRGYIQRVKIEDSHRERPRVVGQQVTNIVEPPLRAMSDDTYGHSPALSAAGGERRHWTDYGSAR